MNIYNFCKRGSDYRVIESAVQYQQLLSDQYTVCSELKSDVYPGEKQSWLPCTLL
jgi:hypothetical protein